MRSQQIRILSQILQKTGKQNLVVSLSDSSDGGNGYKEATVIEPCCSYYENSIVVLDFASLYPSIMMAHNLCYTTLLQEKINDDEYIQTPSTDCFVIPSKRKGLLSEILISLLMTRKRVKTEFARETDSKMRSVLDGCQLALKITTNAVYGFTGAQQYGKSPRVEISWGLTAFGREMIAFAERKVEEIYTSAKFIIIQRHGFFSCSYLIV